MSASPSVICSRPPQRTTNISPHGDLPVPMNDISKYLSAVLQDWHTSRKAFPRNTCPSNQWPLPFFGNPRRPVVATVGVNPSSGEFSPGRNWSTVQTPTELPPVRRACCKNFREPNSIVQSHPTRCELPPPPPPARRDRTGQKFFVMVRGGAVVRKWSSQILE